MLLADDDSFAFPPRREAAHEGIAAVLFELRPLALVADVLQGQLVEAEGLAEELVIGVTRRLAVEPDPLAGLVEAGLDPFRGSGGIRLRGGNQLPHQWTAYRILSKPRSARQRST